MQRQLLQLRRYTKKVEGSATAGANNQHQHLPLDLSKLTWVLVLVVWYNSAPCPPTALCDTANMSAIALHTATNDATRVTAKVCISKKGIWKDKRKKKNKTKIHFFVPIALGSAWHDETQEVKPHVDYRAVGVRSGECCHLLMYLKSQDSVGIQSDYLTVVPLFQCRKIIGYLVIHKLLGTWLVIPQYSL